MKDTWLRNKVAKSAEEKDTMDRVHALLDERIAQRDALIRKFTGPSASDVPAPAPGSRKFGLLDGKRIVESEHKCKACGCGSDKRKRAPRIL